MPILGLLSTESFATERFKNYRRSVLYHYPQGAAPLTGILSLMDEQDTDDPEFNWYEKRLRDQRTTTASQGTSKGPFLRSDGTTDAGDPVDDGSNNGLKADTEYCVKVAATEQFRIGHLIRIPVKVNSGAGDFVVKGVVTAIVSSTVLKFRALVSKAKVAGIDNGATNENVGVEVLIIGSAFAQGSRDVSSESYNLPLPFTNYCQIFRTPFSLTGTALKTGAKFDESGPYKDKAKEHSLYHMIEMEKNIIFGEQRKFVDGTTGLPTYTTGGILWFLEQWETGTPYGVTAATADTDDNKRIITNASGAMNEKTYDGYLERVFRVTSNKANEKLVLCGSGFLSVINQMYRSQAVLNADLPMTDTFGMSVVRHTTPFGTILYKTHPLFSQNPTLRNNALFLDVHNLHYRNVQGRDTELLKNRQERDADYRKDEYLTEAGLEVWYPESHMYLQNVADYTP